MRKTITIAMLALLALAATRAHAAGPGRTTFTETFEGGNNTGGWSLGNPFLEAIESTGGRPGAYLHFPDLDTFAPQARTTLPGSTFTGNYRERGVSGAGIDLVLHRVDFSAEDRPLAVMLTNDGGTVDDFFDDCIVYFLGHKQGPRPNSVWQSYNFKIPAGSEVLPRGWKVLFCGDLGSDAAWNRVIEDVDELRFHVGDPELFFIFQVWDIGMDNPTIISGTPEPDPAVVGPGFEVEILPAPKDAVIFAPAR